MAWWKSSGTGRVPDPGEDGSGKKQARFWVLVMARISSVVGLADASSFPGGSSHPPNYSPSSFLHSENLFFSNPLPKSRNTASFPHIALFHTKYTSSLYLTSSLFTSNPNWTMRNHSKPCASTTDSKAGIIANSSQSLCLMFGGDGSGSGYWTKSTKRDLH